MRAEVFRATRLPKFFKYFQTVLASNPAAEAEGGEGKGKSTFLIGAQTTTADLTVFHVSYSLLNVSVLIKLLSDFIHRSLRVLSLLFRSGWLL